VDLPSAFLRAVPLLSSSRRRPKRNPKPKSSTQLKQSLRLREKISSTKTLSVSVSQLKLSMPTLTNATEMKSKPGAALVKDTPK
jgi:hypothetical protein